MWGRSNLRGVLIFLWLLGMFWGFDLGEVIVSNDTNQYVYVLYNESNKFYYKIGWTSRKPQDRANEINRNTGVVGIWEVGHQWKVEDGYWLEQRIFREFSQHRQERKEIFHFPNHAVEQVADKISQFINISGESPKRAAEIAAKELKERKQKKKLEEEQQRAKYAYDAECNKIKIEIQNIQHSNLEKALKNDTELKEYFYICMFISFIIGTGISLHNGKGFIVWVVLCLIIGWVFYFFKKDSKYHEIKNKYLTPLSDNLEQLKKIRDEISKIDTTPHQNKLSSNTINHTSTKEQQFPDTTEINTPNPQPKNEDKIPVGVMVFLGILVFFGLVGIMEELNKDNRSSSQTKYTPPQPPVSEPQEETPIPQEEQQPDIVNTQQPQEIPTQVIEQNPPIKQSPQTKPKEVYTPPQNNSVSPEYLAAEQAHFNKILAAHPDAIAIVESQAFKNWVNNQSASNQSYYNKVLNNGSATQVINMFNQYKKDLRSPPNNQQTISNPPQPQKRTSQDIYEQYQKPLIPSADKPLTIQSVENMPEME